MKYPLTPIQVIREISWLLEQAEGEFIEKIANQVLPKPVKYVGDSIFEQEDKLEDKMLDKHDLDSIEAEYKELYLAQLTDDVDCSPSTWQHRESCLKAIEEKVGTYLVTQWSRETEAKAKEVGMASGAPYEE